jgi:hypothetical protein
MRKPQALVIWVTFAVVSAYLLFIPGNGHAARKAAMAHILTPIPAPEVLFAHKAAILARHRAMVIEIRRQRVRTHQLFLRRQAIRRARARALAEARARAAVAAQPVPSASPSSIPSANGPSPQSIVARLLNPAEAACIGAIFTRESGWNVYATNAQSGAYGIPQALPGDKMASAGADWRTSALTQIRWAIGYVDSRYGSACAAWAYWQIHGNY